jgi:hypothetical protein
MTEHPTKESGIPRIEQLYTKIRLQLDYPAPDTYLEALRALDVLATMARERPE